MFCNTPPSSAWGGVLSSCSWSHLPLAEGWDAEARGQCSGGRRSIGSGRWPCVPASRKQARRAGVEVSNGILRLAVVLGVLTVAVVPLACSSESHPLPEGCEATDGVYLRVVTHGQRGELMLAWRWQGAEVTQWWYRTSQEPLAEGESWYEWERERKSGDLVEIPGGGGGAHPPPYRARARVLPLRGKGPAGKWRSRCVALGIRLGRRQGWTTDLWRRHGRQRGWPHGMAGAQTRRI